MNLKKIIEAYGLNKEFLAEKLFPGNGHPKLALHRLTEGITKLNVDHIKIIADICNVPVSYLFDEPEWRGRFANGLYIFQQAQYRAEYNVKERTIKMYDDNLPFYVYTVADPLYPEELIKILDGLLTYNEQRKSML